MNLLMVFYGRKLRVAARSISEKAICVIDRRRGLYKNYLSDR